jgi:hypothetical protein
MSELELLLLGDAKQTLATLADESIDALVTDPPAGIAFMGKDWDEDHGGRDGWVRAFADVFRECLRILKPGAHGLVWALPRTSHWTATALEDAGFEIRDRVSHLFGTGFPKSLDVSKAIDKAAGAERQVVGASAYAARANTHGRAMSPGDLPRGAEDTREITAAATPLAQQWEGWGTALKPACEDWWLVRKPLEGTVAANVAAHGTGALNIDGCRIDTTDAIEPFGTPRKSVGGLLNKTEIRDAAWSQNPSGRWPANVTLSHNDDCERVGTRSVKSGVAGAEGRGFRSEYVGGEAKEWAQRVPATFNGPDGLETVEAWRCTPGCAAALLDEQSGKLKSGLLSLKHRGHAARLGTNTYGVDAGSEQAFPREWGGDAGGASRFFYCAKPSRSERDLGCDSLPAATGGEATGRVDGSAGTNSPRAGAGRTGGARNVHPTVKAVNLMRWLCRLVTPPGGIVLDPFMGSGSTGLACQREALRFIGIERDPAYFDIAKARLGQGAPTELPLLGDAA